MSNPAGATRRGFFVHHMRKCSEPQIADQIIHGEADCKDGEKERRPAPLGRAWFRPPPRKLRCQKSEQRQNDNSEIDRHAQAPSAMRYWQARHSS